MFKIFASASLFALTDAVNLNGDSTAPVTAPATPPTTAAPAPVTAPAMPPTTLAPIIIPEAEDGPIPTEVAYDWTCPMNEPCTPITAHPFDLAKNKLHSSVDAAYKWRQANGSQQVMDYLPTPE